MKEMVADIWHLHDKGWIVCITTNGYVKKNGSAVMGRGTAAQAMRRYSWLPEALGDMLTEHGNVVSVFSVSSKPSLVTFPVKPRSGICNRIKSNVVQHMRHRFKPYDTVPGWAMIADITLIEKSLERLDKLRKLFEWDRVALPRPGCGAGELDWETQVKPLCEKYGDWLIVVNRN